MAKKKWSKRFDELKAQLVELDAALQEAGARMPQDPGAWDRIANIRAQISGLIEEFDKAKTDSKKDEDAAAAAAAQQGQGA